MYLPIVGLAWITAEFACRVRTRIERANSAALARTIFRATALAIGIAFIAQAWHVEASYDNSLAKTYRIAEVFPNELAGPISGSDRGREERTRTRSRSRP
jgi:hypothetical protein